ncbi:hypothetical protein COU37_00055 [Candidatus Micrarchaeota archaeon CG10_big_fil_rev_8_21_14_0_10_45_29]|nr:MAG: hypothetical protein COU37_00055 [Candidatus Micrarchaeota archaeon CG10_big_fil_rev_8_21_14_0_10_45_29]
MAGTGRGRGLKEMGLNICLSIYYNIRGDERGKFMWKIFNRKIGKTGNAFNARDILHPEARSANVAAILERIAQKNGLNSSYEIFEQDRTKNIKMQAEFVREARKSGCSDEKIGQEIERAQYPARIKNYKSMSVDQACAQEILGSDDINWADLLGGGKRIVENGISLGGTFAKLTTPKDYEDIQCTHNSSVLCNESSGIEVANEIADALYLLEHAQHANLPQAPYIIFAECSKGGEGDFDRAKRRATGHRLSFKRHLAGIVGNIDYADHLKISDTAHGGTTKYRMLCTVFDEATGGLMVVSEKDNLDGSKKMPIKFSDWIKTTDEKGRFVKLRNLLSASDAELEEIMSIAHREGGLIEKLQTPANCEGYAPWNELREEIKAQMREKNQDGNENGWYKKACKVWKYALLIDSAQNSLWYEQNWKDIKLVNEVKKSFQTCVCDDSRQEGDVKVLAAFLTEFEFAHLVGEEGLKQIVFSPHYQCGFLSAAHQIHRSFERFWQILQNDLEHDKGGFSEYTRSIKFFCNLMQEIRRGSGPVTTVNVLKEYLPQFLVDELDEFLQDRANGATKHGTGGNRALVQFLFETFIDNREKMRAVIRRGIDSGVLEQASDSQFILMPAAKDIYGRLYTYFGDGYREEFSSEKINNLIIEEAARRKLAQYKEWIEKMGLEGQIEIIVRMENFYTGQYTKLPKKSPKSPQKLKNDSRKDYYLTDENLFTRQEVQDLGLNSCLEWKMAP